MSQALSQLPALEEQVADLLAQIEHLAAVAHRIIEDSRREAEERAAALAGRPAQQEVFF